VEEEEEDDSEEEEEGKVEKLDIQRRLRARRRKFNIDRVRALMSESPPACPAEQHMPFVSVTTSV